MPPSDFIFSWTRDGAAGLLWEILQKREESPTVLEWTLSACVVDGLGVGGDVTLDAAAVPVMVYVSIRNHTSFGPALQDFKAADIWGSERDSPWDDERMSWISFMKR
ncbi:hypothetical protein B0H14DRAFT_2556941 [Mycena olivaceomarginata]|nr:hypothetical protein B0H14DRAFT_2556941 [Mycena olivaceomarginata]